MNKLDRIAGELKAAIGEANDTLTRKENEINQLCLEVRRLNDALIQERVLKSSWERCARRFKHNEKEAIELLRQLINQSKEVKP